MGAHRLLLYTAVMRGPLLCFAAILGLSEPSLAADPKALAEAFQSETGVALEWARESLAVRGDRGEEYGCDAPFDEEIQIAVAHVIRELSYYPAPVLKKTGITKLVFCRDLSVRFEETRKRTVDGAEDRRTEQAVPAFATYREMAIYLDAARFVRASPRWKRSVVHHELFHLLDYRHPNRANIDKAWRAANPPGFSYGSGGIDMQDAHGTGLRMDLRGFTEAYATASIEEDKAKLYDRLLTDPELARLVEKDEYVKKKLGILKRMLLEFAPALDDARLSRIVSGR